MTSKIDSSFINNLLVRGFNSNLEIILKTICDKNPSMEQSFSQLLEEHCLSKIEIEDMSSSKRKKRKKNKILDSQELCMAKKADGMQCTRRRKEQCEYCGKHVNNLKFGRIDDEVKYQDKEKYIKTKHDKINGEDYLVDDNNFVYNFDKNNPKLVGKKVDGELVVIEKILEVC